MLKITDNNYDDYKKVFGILWNFIAKVNKLDPYGEYSPLILLEKSEKKNKSHTKSELKASLMDAITMCMDMSINMKNDINNQLAIQGLIGFNHLVSIVKDTLQKVLKRGKIRNLDEYYILKDLLDDSTIGVSEAEKTQIAKLLISFEMIYAKRKNR